MPYLKAYRLTTGSVANGSTKEDSFSSPSAYTIKKILVTPRGNSPMTNVQFYAELDGVPFMHPDIPADLLDPLNPNLAPLNFAFPKGSKFVYKLTNNSGAAETYDVTLLLETAEWPPAKD